MKTRNINNALINQLKEKGIQFSKGLTDEEIHNIEKIYDIKLPRSLCNFYYYGIPFIENKAGSSFPQWKDYSETNIQKIKRRISAPIEWLLLDVKQGFWLSDWGPRGDSIDERIGHFREMVINAPRLIPVYSHRYIPQIANSDDPPVISTVGSDTIYYGSNLQEYLYNEFLNDGRLTISKRDTYIPFWSEIININQK